MEPCFRLLTISLLLIGTLSGTTNAFPNSTHCEDFSSKCALVEEAKAFGLEDMMCNAEENGEKLGHFCPVACNMCMGKHRYFATFP